MLVASGCSFLLALVARRPCRLAIADDAVSSQLLVLVVHLLTIAGASIPSLLMAASDWMLIVADAGRSSL